MGYRKNSTNKEAYSIKSLHKKWQIKNIALYLKEQIKKLKVIRREETIKYKAEINEIENKIKYSSILER